MNAPGQFWFDACSLWIIPPPHFPSSLLTRGLERESAASITDTGIEVMGLEVFDLYSDAAVEDIKPLLDMGARLGGKAALAIIYSNPDAARTAEILARIAEAATSFGLAANLEPIVGGKTQTLHDARELIRASGADVSICLDPHHLFRTGGTISDVAALEQNLVRDVQLCNGLISHPPEIAETEAGCERLYPGDGDFPLVELLRAAPRDVPLGVECPSLGGAQAGVSARPGKGGDIEGQAPLGPGRPMRR